MVMILYYDDQVVVRGLQAQFAAFIRTIFRSGRSILQPCISSGYLDHADRRRIRSQSAALQPLIDEEVAKAF